MNAITKTVLFGLGASSILASDDTRALYELRAKTVSVGTAVNHNLIDSLLNHLVPDKDKEDAAKIIASIHLKQRDALSSLPSLLEMNTAVGGDCDNECDGVGVQIIKATKLEDKDWFFWGQSDPIVVAKAFSVKSGATSFPEKTKDAESDEQFQMVGTSYTTPFIKDSLNPVWEKACHCFVGDNIDVITFDVYDKDKHSVKKIHANDDSLGRAVAVAESFEGTVTSSNGIHSHKTLEECSTAEEGCPLDLRNNDNDGDFLFIKTDLRAENVVEKSEKVEDKGDDPEESTIDDPSNLSETEDDEIIDKDSTATTDDAEAQAAAKLEAENAENELAEAERKEKELLAAKVQAEKDATEAAEIAAAEVEATQKQELEEQAQRKKDAAKEAQRLEAEALAEVEAKRAASAKAQARWKKLSSISSASNALTDAGEDNAAANKQKPDTDQIIDTAEKCSGDFCWACEHRIRKDFRDLTTTERALWWQAMNDMKKHPTTRKDGTASNLYDEFVIVHAFKDNKPQAHGTSMFLPWHRKFLMEFETAIRVTLKDGDYKCLTIPYWDWSQNAEICANDPDCKTWHHDDPVLQESGGPGVVPGRNDPKSVGPTHGSSIDATRSNKMVGCMSEESPFFGWKDHNGNCLSRGVSWDFASNQNDRKGPLVTYTQLMDIIHNHENYGTYNGFRQALEGTPHNTQHNMLGGHMRSLESPADPIFFMHHCQVDRIWAMWQDCHDHDARPPTKKDMPMYGDSRRYSFKTGLNARMLYRHPSMIGEEDPKEVIETWNTQQYTPKPFHSSTTMDIPVVYAPDEMMKIMKNTQKKQICNYDTHNTFLIEVGLEHILSPLYQDTPLGKKIQASCEEIASKLEKRLENPDTSDMNSALMEAATKQCRKENKKAFGSKHENGPKTLEVRFLKRWLNQGMDDQAGEECDSEGGEKVKCDRFQNVLDNAPEQLLPRCSLFHGITMEDKRKLMREAIVKALSDEEEEDGFSNEDAVGDDNSAEEEAEEVGGGLRGEKSSN